jgi:LacI family transcriptional regulator, galactose operon repressor
MKRTSPKEPRKKLARATLSDVAKAAGVSVMTVSNFVHAKPVRIKTRKLVEAAIARLNYRPNVSARSLRLAEEYSVGIVIADSDPAYLNDPFISRLVSGLSNYLSSLDYTLDVQGVAPERFENATILSKVGNEALCAILCGPQSIRREHFDYLNRLGQPVVVFREAFQPPGPNMAVVGQDDLSGGRQLGRHLLERRLKSVLFVRASLSWCAVEQREKGLRSVLAAASPAVEVKTLISPSERFDDVHQVVKDQLAKRLPGAIVAATDSMAAAALKACESAGLKVPKDLMLAGFNGFDVWRLTSPTLTTVMSPAYELGRTAGELLLERLKTGKFSRRTVVLPVRLQPAESTGG